MLVVGAGEDASADEGQLLGAEGDGERVEGVWLTGGWEVGVELYGREEGGG